MRRIIDLKRLLKDRVLGNLKMVCNVKERELELNVISLFTVNITVLVGVCSIT